MSFNRIAAIGGIIGVVLLILNGVLLGNQPALDVSIEEVRQYIGEDAAMHRTAMVFGIATLPFYAVFFSGVAMRLRDSDREHGEGWAIVAIVGAILLFATAAIGDTMAVVLFLRGGDGLDDSAVRALYDTWLVSYGSIGVAVAALTGSVAIATLRHRIWPTWYGWLAALVAIIGFISVGGVAWTSTALVLVFAVFIGILVWTLVTSVLMYREG